MHKTLFRTLGVSAATAALAVFAYTAQAQAPKKDTPKKPPACNSLKAQADCEGRSDCNWVAETKDKNGKVKKKAYCRANPKKPAPKTK